MEQNGLHFWGTTLYLCCIINHIIVFVVKVAAPPPTRKPSVITTARVAPQGAQVFLTPVSMNSSPLALPTGQVVSSTPIRTTLPTAAQHQTSTTSVQLVKVIGKYLEQSPKIQQKKKCTCLGDWNLKQQYSQTSIIWASIIQIFSINQTFYSSPDCFINIISMGF